MVPQVVPDALADHAVQLLMRPVSYAYMASSTRCRAPSLFSKAVRPLVQIIELRIDGEPLWQGVAVVRFAHIGMDRDLGYGPKYETDF